MSLLAAVTLGVVAWRSRSMSRQWFTASPGGRLWVITTSPQRLVLSICSPWPGESDSGFSSRDHANGTDNLRPWFDGAQNKLITYQLPLHVDETEGQMTVATRLSDKRAALPNEPIIYFTPMQMTVWRFPYPVAIAPLSVLPITARRIRTRRRVKGVLCPVCGYDLQATPGRCPECGRVPVRAAT